MNAGALHVDDSLSLYNPDYIREVEITIHIREGETRPAKKSIEYIEKSGDFCRLMYTRAFPCRIGSALRMSHDCE